MHEFHSVEIENIHGCSLRIGDRTIPLKQRIVNLSKRESYLGKEFSENFSRSQLSFIREILICQFCQFYATYF